MHASPFGFEESNGVVKRGVCLNYRFAVLFGLISIATVSVQLVSAQEKPDTSTGSATSSANPPSQGPVAVTTPQSKTLDTLQPKVDDQKKTDDPSGRQTSRILGIIPNYRSVSADTQLPSLNFKQKFWLATQDSFDYSSFIYEGILAGMAMAQKSEPSFGQGASGYGLYYAHNFADGTIENYLVGAFVPAVTKEDPRYYTLGHGGFVKRTGYALSRLVITRTDSGNRTVNLSEIIGAGAAAGISNTYYPAESNPWVKTYQRWGSQLIQDAIGNVAKEFWPDINRALFHDKY